MRSLFKNAGVKLCARLLCAAVMLGAATIAVADQAATSELYDETAYTAHVEDTMKKLDELYLKFCNLCDVEPAQAEAARQEFLATVRDLMQRMNARVDSLDPKKGAALSPTETLVSIHVLTMLVDILTASQMEHWTQHPYIP
jgi:hypothetical protein